MIEWTALGTDEINRIGYNKIKNNLYIDFVGSEVDTVMRCVPEVLYRTFGEVKSPDQFYKQFVLGYFDIADIST